MTESPAASVSRPSARPPADRPTGLRLARVHLRMGSLVLARAELEAFAGRGELDDDAIVDLAEARWRTGDLAGAGEVATAAIAAGRADPIALVIAAEATAALGRPGEARRLAGRALEAVGGTLDPLFAGMPRSLIWPADPERPTDSRGAGVAAAGTGGSHRELERAALPDAADALETGRRMVARGEVADGIHRLAIALRLGPALAPAVLDALGAAGGPEAELLRGDAYRLVGREIEARKSYAVVLRTLTERQAGGGGGGLGPSPSDAPQPPAADPSAEGADPAGIADPRDRAAAEPRDPATIADRPDPD